MIDSEAKPKVEELRVIEKELRSMLHHMHSLHFFRTLIFCKNNLTLNFYFVKCKYYRSFEFVNVHGHAQNEVLPRN